MLKKLCLAVAALSTTAAFAQAPEVTLTRLDCGTGFNDSRRFSDTFAYTDPKVPFTFSCYVVKHGDDYMVWDTGFVPGSNPNAPKVSLTDQLGAAQDQARAGEVRRHQPFPRRPHRPAASLAGRDAADRPARMGGAHGAEADGGRQRRRRSQHWISGGGKVEPQPADKDVFGDGTVMILRTPGHTPGHQSLLVRLKEKGPVILVGDAAHFHENYESDGVPGFNYDRAETIASLERIKGIEKNLKATVIIQHDPRDIGKLPAFPAAAK